MPNQLSVTDNPDASLYAQPTAAPKSLLNDPLDVLKMSYLSKQIQGQQAAGEATLAGIQPDGSFDPSVSMNALKGNPNAAFGAPGAVGTLLNQREKNVQYSTSQFGLGVGQSGYAQSQIGALANKPGATKDDLNTTLLDIARNTNIPSATLNGFAAGAPTDPRALHDYFVTLQNKAIGAAGTSQRVTGAPTAAGAPTQQPLGAANYGGAQQPVGLAPGVGEAAQATGEASGRQYSSDLSDSSHYARDIFPLQQAIPALENLGKTGTGPGTEQRNSIVSFLQSMGVPGIDASKITDFDTSRKYLTDWVNQNGDHSSNDKFLAAVAGNPSVNISNAAAIDVAKNALALRMMKQGQLAAFQATGLPPEQYSKWVSNNWSGKLDDPRAYGFSMMTPEAQRTMLSNMKPAELAKFGASLRAAHNGGVTSNGQ